MIPKIISNQIGFTLIEVLIALAVVAIGLTAVLNANLHAISHASRIQNKIFALWVLENKAAELRLNNASESTGTEEGEQLQGGQSWSWQTKTEVTANKKINKTQIKIFASESENESTPLIEQTIYLRATP